MAVYQIDWWSFHLLMVQLNLVYPACLLSICYYLGLWLTIHLAYSVCQGNNCCHVCVCLYGLASERLRNSRNAPQHVFLSHMKSCLTFLKFYPAGLYTLVNICFIIVQILISCFVKTSHFEEYLCVKVSEDAATNPIWRVSVIHNIL